jgi:hypothetical protein
MSTAVTIEGTAETSPRAMARITGALYLLTIVAGIIAQGFISETLIVPGNAATTASNISAQEPLFRLGFTIYLIEMAAQIAMTVLFYYLLKPVSRTASLVGAVFSLVGCTIKTLSRLFYFAPLLVLDGNAEYLRVFDTDQLQSLALLFLEVNDHGAAMALAFFGFYGLLKGYLVLRSTFLPRFLGVLTLVAGLGWLTFLSPSLGMRLFPILAGVGILGAIANILWLLIVGVNEQRWKEQANLSAASMWR